MVDTEDIMDFNDLFLTGFKIWAQNCSSQYGRFESAENKNISFSSYFVMKC